MAWTEVAANSVTTDGTEQTISGASYTTSGTYILSINAKNIANGDMVIIRVKTKVDASDSADVAYDGLYANVQAAPKKFSIAVPITSNGEITFTIERKTGTDRAYRYSIMRA
jgi:hypothetical protein